MLGSSHQLETSRFQPVGWNRQMARRLLTQRLVAHEALDDAVFERMKADDRETSAGLQPVDTLRQHGAQLFQFAVEINPYSLEAAGRRVLPRFAFFDRCGDEGRQLPRAADGF